MTPPQIAVIVIVSACAASFSALTALISVLTARQNWSGDGVLRNRDATLIIHNEQAARYWEKIFIHDWTKMAIQHSAD